MLKIDQI